ncbi:M13 family metallopeptidase [Mesoterricola silvestris]|uniref:Peptidase M13 n=1 Tax=Mesoterricola silvestris TaxID=2927979 RepID=A0AA48KCE1_9BACT|nr:M13 family metallopeptidase [Mesoterricola silvestris]BDU73403.1 peptidase M13 [Mesoterricola silvestris]
MRRLVLAALPALVAFAGPQGLDLKGMDRAVAPGDDFFAYANGSWLRATPIPPDRSAVGAGSQLVEVTAARTAAILKAALGARPGSEARKTGDYFASFMDEAAIEALGAKPLQPVLARIRAVGDRRALAEALGRTLRADVDVLNNTSPATPNFLGLWVAQDLDDPSRYSPFLLQGGLGMPDREYYLSDSEAMKGIRAKYLAHIGTMLRLAGVEDAAARAGRILDLEGRIAKVHAGNLDTFDVQKGNNHWNREAFPARAPGLDWEAFFGAAGLGGQKTFVVWQPSALIGLAALAGAESLETWKDWMVFHAVEKAAPTLSRAFVEASFAFHGGVLQGTPQLRARWKRGVDATNAALGDAVGKLYVKRHFPAAEKARAQAMVRNLIKAFAARIDALEWMAPETKAKAKAKLAVLKVGVGYPDRWISYGGLRVVPGDAFGNAERAELFDYRRNVAKLGGPVDRGEWVMTPQTVNAVNLPAMNALNFPAAILQPPFFDPRRAAVLDYGAAGATMGHEISHSFDDTGALFDAQGRLSNWWTPNDFAHFKASGARLARQFDAYRPFPDLAVNGALTLSENIADVAGLAASYDAYHLSLGGRPDAVRQGFTGDQQFFLSYAQSWRGKAREPARRQQILTDGHAPEEYRADSVRNQDAWYPAFGVKPGQKLALEPRDRVRIW